MILSIKKTILLIIILFIFTGFVNNTFAQSLPVSNLEIDSVNKALSGTINPGVRGDISLSFIDTNKKPTFIDTINASGSNFSLSLRDFSILEPQVFQGKAVFDQLLVINEGQESSIDLADIFSGNNQSQASVNFPGWEESEYRQIAGTDAYYPYISSTNFQRTPAATDIYLILEDTTTGQKIDLETYPGGSQSLSITWPVEPPTSSLLLPGATYKIYLSTTIDSSSGVITSTDQTTEKNIKGSVPGASDNNIVSITSTLAKKRGNKNYYEISGVINETGPKNSLINFSIRKSGETGGELLGQIPYVAGPFTVPDQQELDIFTSLPIGDYQLAINATTNNSELLQPLGELPSITGDVVVKDDGTHNNSGGSTTPLLNNTQQNIVDNGIVTTECGYNLSGTKKDAKGNLLPKGKICGFGQAITLIQRIIEYIFILVLPITAIVFAYAGYLYLTSGGSSTKRDAAKKAMTSALIGVIIIMSAWLVVRTIVGALGYDTSSTNTSFYLTQ